MPTTWKPILGKAYFEHEEYKILFPQPFIDSINDELEIFDENGRLEMGEYLLYAARNYELKKQNLHHFYQNSTERSHQIKQFQTGLKKTLNSWKKLRKDEGRYAFTSILMAFKHRYGESKPNILDTSITHPTKIQISELDRFENLLSLFVSSCDDALKALTKSHKMTPTEPIEDWLRPIRHIWIKYKSPITFTEGNPDYADYSKAVNICHKIITVIDPNVEKHTLAGVIKRMKNKPL